MKKNIAILRGGNSSEIAISIKSADLVYKNIDTEFYVPFIVHIEGLDWFVWHNESKIELDKNDFSFQLKNKKIKFEGVFMAIHGTPGEDGILQGYFDLLNIPYNCSGAFESALTFNKAMCNALLKQFNIPSAKAVLLNKNETYDLLKIEKEIGLPCFVKPNRAGSSFGISKVYKNTEFKQALIDAFIHDSQVMIESYVEGTEVSCGIIQQAETLVAFPLTEITTENDFFDYEAKYNGKSDEITPARVSDLDKDLVQTLSKKIYKLLNLKGMVRMDFILENQQAYLIEVNTIPGLSEESIIPQQSKSYGMSLKELFSLSLMNMFKND
ncbi:D-alanine--D-alanine ligase [Flavobacteriales bacterium]|nr:D-alanine--D-alanine ligase [Flavobacteriales bacterium]MDG1144928.1 D-alanine--D-alanine ligase [Flavobacteriales bacterium]|tara:strand:- start:82 stop:1059 length:978 start_codon:yes stop_codon:yes gene_type:complete